MSDLTLEKMKLNERLVRLEELMSRIEKYMEKHEKLIFGNGQLGCTTRLKSLEDTASLNKLNIEKLFHKIGGLNRTIWIAIGFVSAVNFFLAHSGFAQHFLGAK